VGLYLPQRWKRQPQGPQRIDWGNPLAAGLTGLHVPGTALHTAVGGATTQAGVCGRGFVAGASQYWQVSDQARVSASPTWTILAFARLPSSGSGSGRTAYCERPNDPHIVKIHWGLGSNPQAGVTVRDQAYAGLINDAPPEAVIAASSICTFGAARYGPSDHRVIVNGRQTNALTTTVPFNFGATAATVGNDPQDSSSASFSDGLLFAVCTWSRPLSDSELRAWHENPWQLFAPQRAAFFSLPAASGPVLSLPTVTDITSTSVRPRVTFTI